MSKSNRGLFRGTARPRDRAAPRLPPGTGPLPFSGPSTSIPAGWLLCDGRAVSRLVYADLFVAIGTQYGTGDGATTFNVPDMRGVMPVGVDTGQTEFDTVGETGGAKTVTLTLGEMPSHRHTLEALDTAGVTGGSANRFVLADGAASQDFFMSNTGSGTAHQNLPPYRAFHFMVKT